MRILVWGGLLLLIATSLLFPKPYRPPAAVLRAHAKSDVIQLCQALKQYHVEYRAMPPGNHAGILAALRGNNPRRIVFFETLPEKFNTRGQLIDPWGTPYQIDVSNPAFPWAYSFGRDTRDDGGAPGSDDITSWR